MLKHVCIYSAVLAVAIDIVSSQASQPDWKEYGNSRYFIGEGDLINWFDAQTECNQYGGYLASVLSVQERDKINEWVAKEEITGAVWIGLTKYLKDDWEWVGTDEGETVSAQFWRSGYPVTDDKLGDYHLCAGQESSGWVNRHCDGAFPYICKAAKDASSTMLPPTTVPVEGYCPPGYLGADAIGNKCFKMVFTEPGEGATWLQALGICRNETAGLYPDLASVQSDYETALLTSQIQRNTQGLWLGLNRSSTWGQWMDNSPWGYKNWGTGEPSNGPNEHCAEMWYTPGPPGSWNDHNCDDKRGYICQVYKDPSKHYSEPARTTLVPCPADYIPYGRACYRFLEAAQTWQDQQKACQDANKDATMVTIHSGEENAAILTKILGHQANVWIGLGVTSENGSFVWVDGWNVYFTNWGTGEPSGVEDGGCVAMHPDGKWFDTTCDTELSTICKIPYEEPLTTPAPSNGACPDEHLADTKWKKHGTDCYLRVDNSQTWTGALTECKSYPEGNLASIHSLQDNEFVYEMMTTNPTARAASFWIGLYQKTQVDEFSWTDGSIVQYTNWAPGEPNDGASQECVEVYTSGREKQWNDHICTEYRPFVCRAPQSATIIPPGSEGTCPEDWEGYGGSCYFFVLHDPQKQDVAEAHCQDLSRDAHLPTITNKFVQEYLFRQTKERYNLPGAKFDSWIGLKKDPANDYYLSWMSGEPFDNSVFNQWGPGEPSDHITGADNCVDMEHETGDWRDCNCDVPHVYICEKPKDQPGLSGADIAGIVIGVIAAVILLVVLVVFLLDRYGIVNVRRRYEDTKKILGIDNENYDQHDNEAASGEAADDTTRGGN